MTISNNLINFAGLSSGELPTDFFNLKNVNFGFGWTPATTDFAVLSPAWVKHKTLEITYL